MVLGPSPVALTQLSQLVEAQPGWRRIGQILLDLGSLNQAQLDGALAAQYQRSPPIGLLDLLTRAGIHYAHAGEILEFNNEPPLQATQFALREFFTSPEHRRTILNPDYHEIGLGIAQQGDRRYFTALFRDPE
jgi:hypothetical protein